MTVDFDDYDSYAPIAPRSIPATPSSPRRARVAALALAIGAVACVGVATAVVRGDSGPGASTVGAGAPAAVAPLLSTSS